MHGFRVYPFNPKTLNFKTLPEWVALHMAQVLVYMSPACGALLLACAAVWERDALLPSRGLAVAARNPLGFSAALCMGFFVNLTTAYAIQMTSSLTFKARAPARTRQRLHTCFTLHGLACSLWIRGCGLGWAAQGSVGC